MARKRKLGSAESEKLVRSACKDVRHKTHQYDSNKERTWNEKNIYIKLHTFGEKCF